jgi:DNA gyrase subunit A
MAICFSESDARPMGRDTRGVRGIKLRDGDEVVSAATITEGEEILLLTSGGYGKRTAMSQFPKQKRGGIGVKAMKLTRVRGDLVAALALNREDQIFITSSDGIVIRQAAGEISRQKRASTGVKVMSLSEGTVLAAAALVPRDDEEEEG